MVRGAALVATRDQTDRRVAEGVERLEEALPGTAKTVSAP